MTENRTILEKAQLAITDLTTNGGYLEDAQSSKLIQVLIKQSRLMRDAAVRPMANPKELIETIRFGSRVLRPGNEGTALPEADRVKPDLAKVELDAQLFRAEAPVTDEVFEDNIERGQLRQTLMAILAEAIGRDMEEVLVQGDTGSSDTFLKVLDGVLKQASSNVVDAASATLSKTILRDAWKTMPQEFRRMKDRMRYYTSPNAQADYADTIADRATPAGDAALQDDVNIRYSGLPVASVSLFPEETSGSDILTQVLLTDPQNIRVGVHRKIRVEVDRDIRAGLVFLVASLRFDVKYVEETAVVKVTNVKVN